MRNTLYHLVFIKYIFFFKLQLQLCIYLCIIMCLDLFFFCDFFLIKIYLNKIKKIIFIFQKRIFRLLLLHLWLLSTITKMLTEYKAFFFFEYIKCTVFNVITRNKYNNRFNIYFFNYL